ncbi:AMIN domain-containing protein [Hyalangium sp.]|uniref:AMIN domain-containing protein n=1 Tax=Hyalangium sp. TaxID=2028555 RepID=UPI002D7194ED|nr:AMIN domain-containing protein [Hyalangium sp.]HYH97637.1 AMIN domain-containing protein [Hyalangium sp.]
MKFLAVCVLGWVLVPQLALAQEKVELNAITSVKVNGSTVEITGSKKPNFTTFTMTDPPRLVVDISEAVLRGVPEEMRVNGGLITGLRSANYGSDSSAIARVLIGYDRDVETDIQVTGNVLAVKVLDGTSPLVAQAPTEQPLVAANGPTAAEAQAAATQATQAAQQGRATDEGATAEAAAAAKKAEEERRQQEEAARVAAAKQAEDDLRARELATVEEKKRQEELARAEAQAKKQAEADEKKRKAEEARAEVEAKKQAEADEKKRRAEEAEQKRLAALEEKKRKAEEARAEVEAKKQAEADEKKRRAEEAEQKRLAALEERKRKAEEAREADAEERKRKADEAEQRRLAALEEKKRREEAGGSRVASAEVPGRAEPESTSAEPVSGKRKTLEIVGFQQQTGGARVYVRTNEPVSYKVSEGRNEIVLMLENTQIGKGNNTRALDTSFFDTAVARVDPTVGPDRSVRVSIKLKEQVPVQTRQEGNTISLEFARPGR